MDETSRLTRRETLLAAGGALAAAVIPDAAKAAASGTAAVASGTVACVLAPEMTEGPFYVPGEKLRRAIAEGKAGTPLELRLTVLDVARCTPIKNATVEVWHADAGGEYSGAVANRPGTNFLRGAQRTDRTGLASFQTIYPGWYQGRAVHIHVKVHVGGNVVHTGQFFFKDAVTKTVYARAPYESRGGPDVLNAADAIYRNGGSRSLLAVRRRGGGYVGSIAVGVHR